MGAGMQLAGRRSDGSEFPAEISLSAIETEDGLLVSAAIRDVTERIRADAKFRGLLEAAPDAIVGVDRAGRIALVNGQTERLFGYRREELLGQAVEILVPEHVRALHPLHRSAYFADPQQRPMGAGMELAARRADGTEFPAEISLSAIETEDGLLVSAAIRDVTERVEANEERERLIAQAERERYESRLGRSQRLESLGQLAGGVAHDFNNLLAVILNYTTFVAEEIGAEAAGGDPRWAAMAADIEQVQKAGQRAVQLTQQLLTFGRREVVHAEVIDLNAVVAEVRQFLERTIGEHVVLAISLEPDLPRVLADPGRIEQVLVNLAVNARDAMPAGGQLTITTASQFVDDAFADPRPGLGTGPHVVVQVADTGSGMDPETQKRAFEPFFTTKAPRRRIGPRAGDRLRDRVPGRRLHRGGVRGRRRERLHRVPAGHVPRRRGRWRSRRAPGAGPVHDPGRRGRGGHARRHPPDPRAAGATGCWSTGSGREAVAMAAAATPSRSTCC